MKKCLLPLLLSLLCLVLTACGKDTSISGEVTDVLRTTEHDTVLVVQPVSGRPVGVYVEEDTRIFGPEGFDGEAYKAAPRTGVDLSFWAEGHADALTTAEGDTLKLYHAQHYLDVSSYLVEAAYTLPDGAVLDARKGYAGHTAYQLQNGAELLQEDYTPGPENRHVGVLEGYDDLSPAAQTAVTAFYADQGRLYDLDAILEQAHAEYQADPEGFCPYWISQDTAPTASGRQVMYFSTSLTVCVAQEPGSNAYTQNQNITLTAAFDRRTGRQLPLAELFTYPEDQLGEKLLNAVDWLEKEPVKQEMIAAFRLESLSISPDSFGMTFPAGSLPSQELDYVVAADFTDETQALFQPWAVPLSPQADG